LKITAFLFPGNDTWFSGFLRGRHILMPGAMDLAGFLPDESQNAGLGNGALLFCSSVFFLLIELSGNGTVFSCLQNSKTKRLYLIRLQ